MTLTANAPRNEYTATTGQTVFNYTFKIYSDQDLNVYVTPSGQAADDATDITTDYVIDAGTIGAESGGFLTMNTGVTAGYKVTIVSAISEDRTTDYQNNGDFIPETVNNDLDRAVSLVKQAIDAAGRTIGFQESAQNVSALGFEEPQANAFLAWSSDGTKVINASGASIPGLSDAVTQAEAAEANAAASAVNAATSETNAATSETNAAASETNAAASAASAAASAAIVSRFKNALIGNFRINQRAVSGTVVLSAGEYGHDRFKAGSGGCTYTFSTSQGVTTVTVTAGTLQQVVEGENIQTGDYILSWTGTAQAKIDAGSFGDSGQVTASLTGGTQATVEFNTGTIALPQLELGSTVTAFEHRAIQEELALCQRYFIAPSTNLIGDRSYFNGDVTTGNAYAALVKFPVEMRDTPTVTLTNQTNSPEFPSTVGTIDAGASGFSETRTCTGTAAARQFSSSWQAEAEL